MQKHFEDRHVEEVAYLRAKQTKVSVISDVLHLPLATVDNLLKKAEAKGLYRETIEFDPAAKISPERIDQLRQLDYVEGLQDRLRGIGSDRNNRQKRIFQRIHVFDSGSTDDSRRGIETRLVRFGLEVTNCLSELICRARHVGVAWGVTLGSVIKSLDKEQLRIFRGKKRIQFIPTCGEPYGTWLRSNSSSFLAAELDTMVNGEAANRLSLTGIPAVLPKEFVDRNEDAVIRRFIGHCNAYRLIFGSGKNGETPLIDKVDTLLTSVGGAGWHWRMCGVELCKIGGIDRDVFEKLVLGDLGGVLIPSSRFPKPEELRQITEMNSLWTGISRDHYRNIASKGDKHNGVVVLAIGASKAHLVCSAIEAGLVNQLVCDHALAWALCKECGSPAPNELSSPKKVKPGRTGNAVRR